MAHTKGRARGTHVVSGFFARVGYLVSAFLAISFAFLPQTVFAQGAWPVSPASPNVAAVANLFWIIFAIAVVIFIGVEGALFFAVVRFRRRPGVAASQFHGNTRLEIVWTAIPALILLAVYFLTVQTMVTYQAPGGGGGADPIHIKAVAHQWWWEFQYTDEGFSTANEIHVPANTDVVVDVTTADVIHSFWPPQLTPKADAIPNRVQEVWFNAQPGVYSGKCAEFCGVSHAWMYFRVYAVSQSDYQTWLTQQKAPPATVSGLAAQGQRLYQTSGCGACHAISGTSNGNVAPNLTHMASRWTIGAGVLDNNADNMYVWLQDPQAVKPGVLMPNYHFTSDQLKALTAYMESLR